MDLTTHFTHMACALFVGYKALTINETPVLCVFVDDNNNIVLIGYNYTNVLLNGTQHAEFLAAKPLTEAGVDFSKLTLYVTVEPCIMCALFLRQLGIRKVYYGCGNDRFGGNGTVLRINSDRQLIDSTYPSFSGIFRVEAIQMLRNFYIQENESAPVPKVKKNTDIESKLFPENFYTISEEEFIAEFGEARADLYHDKTREITPIVGKGYSLKQFVSLETLRNIPGLEEQLGQVLRSEIDEFCELFYDVDDNGRVQFGKEIRKYSKNGQRETTEDVENNDADETRVKRMKGNNID